MKQINNIIDIISEYAKKYRKIALIVIVVIVVAFAGVTGVSKVKEMKNNKYPIISISGSCKTKYAPDKEIDKDDLDIKARHSNKGTTNLADEEYDISQSKTNKTGPYTEITVTLKSDKKITCNIKIQSNREKVIGFKCGYPLVKNVTAVLYTTGELSFEGEGDVLIQDEGDYLWNNYEEKDNYPIKYVSFSEGVTPSNMDYWFKDNENLKYVESIPSSVVTMIETFSNCESLKEGADLSNATNLLNMDGTYSGCSILTNPGKIPSSVVNMTSTFENCVELLNGADVSEAGNVTIMDSCYKGCVKLSNADIAPNARNISSTFEECINLKVLNNFPDSVENMDSTFSGCSSLTTVGKIPASVTNMNYTFDNCSLLNYQIIIDANPENYSNAFNNAVVATKLNLAGNSKMLDVLANTCKTGNITVFGQKPNPNLTSRKDVISD